MHSFLWCGVYRLPADRVLSATQLASIPPRVDLCGCPMTDNWGRCDQRLAHMVHGHMSTEVTPMKNTQPMYPPLVPLPTATRSPAALYPPGQDEHGEPRGNWAGERETQGEVTGQGRPRSPKMVQSAEGGKGKDKGERIIVVVRSPCRENYPADAHTSVHKSVLDSANPDRTRSVHLDVLGQRHRQQPVSGTANPGVVKQDKSSRGSIDTTKTHSDPQRVGMYSGKRPIGAANKGKQTKSMA